MSHPVTRIAEIIQANFDTGGRSLGPDTSFAALEFDSLVLVELAVIDAVAGDLHAILASLEDPSSLPIAVAGERATVPLLRGHVVEVVRLDDLRSTPPNAPGSTPLAWATKASVASGPGVLTPAVFT